MSTYTKQDAGCWIDGACGHQNLRAALAELTPDIPVELRESLLGDGPDDFSDEDEALELLQSMTEPGLTWLLVDGDLLLLSDEQLEEAYR